MDEWRQVDEIFEQAREMDAERRSEFLRVRCSSNPNLLARVEKLLRLDAAAGPDFLERPATGALELRGLTPGAPDPLLLRRIAGFTIKSIIARGGMGIVYLAEQERPRREVALKVLHVGVWTATAEKRFDIESRILAYLRHPNIAQVYEAGTNRLESGASVHYFAMEYVPEARTLIRYAAEQSLSLRARLDLFLQLCDAVQHGHQKGIIHRDLKPGNILIGTEVRATEDGARTRLGGTEERPQVKVIDFGIARSTDSDIAVTTMHTEVGQLLGTLAYMSPEQCAADPSKIDTTTDIYSLGVILYKLLTGRMPYDVSNMTIQSAARVICEDVPTRPSLFNKKLRGDVETIILMTLEKDPSKRYSSVATLADDVRQTLRGEPISARPPTAYSRLLRWAARRPKKATALICAVIVTAVTLVTSISLYFVDIRPDKLVVTEDRQTARMVTWRGRPTELSWDTGVDHGIEFESLAERPGNLGSGRLVLLGFSITSQIWPGSLCAFDLDGVTMTPAWQHGLTKNDVPPDLVLDDADTSGFGFHTGTLADVFPAESCPGREVIAVFSCRRSQRVLQIIDLAGKVRFQAIQDGGIWGPYWMQKSGLLVLAGADEEMKHRKAENGLPVEQALVVFAIRPQLDLITKDFLRKCGTNELIAPVWYKYLHPASTPGLQLTIKPSKDSGGYDPRSNIGLSVVAKLGKEGASASFLMVVNEDGEERLGARHKDDSWNRNEASSPDWKSFRLSDDPPCKDRSSTTTSRALSREPSPQSAIINP